MTPALRMSLFFVGIVAFAIVGSWILRHLRPRVQKRVLAGCLSLFGVLSFWRALEEFNKNRSDLIPPIAHLGMAVLFLATGVVSLLLKNRDLSKGGL